MSNCVHTFVCVVDITVGKDEPDSGEYSMCDTVYMLSLLLQATVQNSEALATDCKCYRNCATVRAKEDNFPHNQDMTIHHIFISTDRILSDQVRWTDRPHISYC